jgi:hypothetical protein
LELIVDDLRYRPQRSRALPLIVWIADVGSPYIKILDDNHMARYLGNRIAKGSSDEKLKRKQEQWKVRKRRQRRKKLEAFARAELLARGISEAEIENFLAANA